MNGSHDPGLHAISLRVAVLLSAGCLLSGCLAMNLASRGAPESELREMTFELGPVDLPSAGEHLEAPHVMPLLTQLPASGWIHGFDVELYGADGSAVPMEVFHHLKVMSPDQREFFSSQMLRIAGIGAETGAVRIPMEVGYRFRAGDSILVTAMLHNDTDRSFEEVHLRVNLRYSTDGPWTSPRDVMPFFLHVTAPEEASDFDLPPGASERSMEVRPPVEARILGISGHLHDYGTSVRLEDVTDGRVLWEARPVVGEDGSVIAMPHDNLVWSGGIELDPSHLYRVVATYDNPTGEVIVAGGMGTIAGMLLPSQPWPAVDKADALYILDRKRETSMTHMHG